IRVCENFPLHPQFCGILPATFLLPTTSILTMGHMNTAPDRSPDAARPPLIVRAETNFLRLPLFALSTKGLKTLDGLEFIGRRTHNAQTFRAVLRVTRGLETHYPGPLARAAHLALLSLATEGGVPIAMPIRWSWHQLCQRMGIAYSGTIVRQLRDAL